MSLLPSKMRLSDCADHQIPNSEQEKIKNPVTRTSQKHTTKRKALLLWESTHAAALAAAADPRQHW
jgi:hypothetical protein